MFNWQGNRRRYFFIAIVIIVSATIGYAAGVAHTEKRYDDPALTISPHDKIFSSASDDVDFSLYWDVWDLLKKDYYRQPVKDLDLFYGSLAGLVAGLGDPYSSFFDPRTAEEFNNELSGSFEGIGAEIGIKFDQITIIAPLADSPAERAGLRAGDRVLAIDGFDASFMTLDQAVQLIRGERGTAVVLTVVSKNSNKEKDIRIIRDAITVKSVTWKMLKESDLFLITINNFNTDTKELFRNAVLAALKHNPKGVILDLRNNPGGFLDTAVKVAGYWTGDGTVVFERLSSGDKNIYKAGIEPLLKEYPTVVLVNGGSASASEIVAGALKDYGYATVIGEQTFGKGTVQNLETLSDGSAVKFTIAEWLTPKRNSIEEQGVTPDIVVELTEDDYNNDRDPQLDAGVDYLSKTQ